MRILSILAIIALPIATTSAQVLNDFSAFGNPETTYFTGNWTSGLNLPLGSFSQGSGVYNITGGTNDSSAGVDFYFMAGGDIAPIDLGLNRTLSLSAMLLPNHQATSLKVVLFDNASSTHFASATFDLTGFSSSSYQSLSQSLTADSGFDWSAIQGFTITGGITAGTAALNMSFDSLTAVPEPSTYAAMLGTMVLGFVGYRRYRRN